jgi:AmmeMemoRadiSam system protein B
MTLRKRCLSTGWYPSTAAQTTADITRFLTAPLTAPLTAQKQRAIAAIAPHAGWFYSGSLAATSVLSLKGDADTVAIIGGHLPAGIPPLFFEEDAVETPLGLLQIDAVLRTRLRESLKISAPDRYQDNTIEVLLPLVRYFFPSARLLAFRLPAEPDSFSAGATLAQLGNELGRNLVVLASTDLTHYGPNYDFSPKGLGKPALDWARNINDRAIIQAIEAGDSAAILATSLRDQSACSPGAVLGALGFARTHNVPSASLLAYATSADTTTPIPPSFVGYASIAWSAALHQAM